MVGVACKACTSCVHPAGAADISRSPWPLLLSLLLYLPAVQAYLPLQLYVALELVFSPVAIEGNRILHCALGLAANAPIHPENTISLRGNHFAYNDIALYFYGEKGGHRIHDNRFEQNLLSVAVSAPTSALFQDWRGNHWDEYLGFDQDGDGVGDQPHEVCLHSDQLWLDRPMLRFFRGSPVLDSLDFLERLSAYSTPKLILRDPRPRSR
ncbi:MAG: hypothetical protein HQL47_08725 [Gammaproteobacteria bacterium]|nr:hypothetical protein [Gammaproteobacteria bacterium]